MILKFIRLRLRLRLKRRCEKGEKWKVKGGTWKEGLFGK